MTNAEKAYAAAERMIAESKKKSSLSFEHHETAAIGALPPSIAELPKLEALYLNNTAILDDALVTINGLPKLNSLYLNHTQIGDDGLARLAASTGLTRLALKGTQVTDKSLAWISSQKDLAALYLDQTSITDLRPLRLLTHLADAPKNSGLTFTDCAAANADPQVAAIAAIGDHKARAQALFDLIDAGWAPPTQIATDTPLAPGFTLPVDGPMQSQDVPPLDRDDDQEDLRQDLMRKVGGLIEAIGVSNEWTALRASASHYQDQVNKPLPEMRIKRLYSAGNTLRVAYEANAQAETLGRLNDMMAPLVAAAVRDVVETHGLFLMGFSNAAEVHAQMLAGLTGQRNPAEVAAAAPLVESLDGKPKALDPEDQAAMADDLAAALGAGRSAEIGEHSLRGRLWNMLGAFGRKVVALGTAGGGVLSGHYFIVWVQANEAAILVWLKLTQGAASGWFNHAMTILRGWLG